MGIYFHILLSYLVGKGALSNEMHNSAVLQKNNSASIDLILSQSTASETGLSWANAASKVSCGVLEDTPPILMDNWYWGGVTKLFKWSWDAVVLKLVHRGWRDTEVGGTQRLGWRYMKVRGTLLWNNLFVNC